MNRITFFDYARGLAIACVVLMHNTFEYVSRPVDILLDAFVHNLAIIGVPLFFFISGYFLMFDRESTFILFMKKKFVRVYVPALLWTLLFWFVLSITGNDTGLNISTLLHSLFLLTNPSQYYFIFVLMLLFIAGYFLKRYDLAQLRQFVWLTLIINGLTLLVYECLIWFAPASLSGEWMYRNPLAWIFFFIYGLYVSQQDKELDSGWFRRLRHNQILGLGLLIIFWLITSLESWLLFDRFTPGGQDYFKIASLGYEFFALHYILIFCKQIDSNTFAGRLLLLLAKYSFFIFLIHQPTVPKLIGVERLMLWHEQFHVPTVLLTTCLGLVLPIMLAVCVMTVQRLSKNRLQVASYLGIPS